MKSLSESSLSIKIALLCLVLALLLHIIGFSTTSWVSVSAYGVRSSYSMYLEHEYGLWKGCIKMDIMKTKWTCVSLHRTASWLIVVRLMECVGLIGVAISTLLTVVNVLILTNKTVKQLAAIGAPISGMAIIAGCIYYSIESELWEYGEAGYSYYLCCIAGTIAAVSTIFLCVDTRVTVQSATADPASNYPPGPYPGQVLSPPPTQQSWVVPRPDIRHKCNNCPWQCNRY